MMGRSWTGDEHARGKGQWCRGPDRGMKVARSEVREKDVAGDDAGSKQALCDPGFLGEAVPT